MSPVIRVLFERARPSDASQDAKDPCAAAPGKDDQDPDLEGDRQAPGRVAGLMPRWTSA